MASRGATQGDARKRNEQIKRSMDIETNSRLPLGFNPKLIAPIPEGSRLVWSDEQNCMIFITPEKDEQKK